MNTTLSPYRIIWVEFFPTETSTISRHDRKVFGDVFPDRKEKTHRKPFSSREAAIAYLTNFSATLDQKYKCLLFTDKQFGMATEEDGYAIHYTEKQKSEAYFIG